MTNTGAVDAIYHEPIRIGQICTLLIRNLTLRPNRDRALRSLADAGSGSGYLATTSVDDADLALRIGRSNSKGKAGAKVIRRRSSSWTQDNNAASGGSDDDGRRRATSPGNERRRSRQSCGRDPFTHTGQGSDEVRSSHFPPRPILKTSNSNKDGAFSYFSDLSPSGSSPFPFGEMGSDLLSRSDSRSSSKSSSTLMRRPGGRPRTTSGTSTLSVRSVRFEEQNGSPGLVRLPSTPGASRLAPGGASRFFASDKTLDQIMDERLLGCCVELCCPRADQKPVELRDGSSGPAAFYTAESLRGGLHHSWGSWGGTPLNPHKEFHFPTERAAAEASAATEEGLASSYLQVRVWAKRETWPATAAPDKPGWKLIGIRDLDFRELQRLEGDLTDARLVTAPNTVVLGLLSSVAPHCNEQDSEVQTNADVAEIAAQLASKTANGTQKQFTHTRRLLEQVVYYAVNLDGPVQRASEGLPMAFPSTKSPRRHPTATEGFASDPEAASLDGRKKAVQAEARSLVARDSRKLFQIEDTLAPKRSSGATWVMPNYTKDDSKALLAEHTDVAELRAQINGIHAELDQILGDPEGQVNLRLKHGEALERLRCLREERDRERRDAAGREEELQRRHSELKERKHRLNEGAAALDEYRQFVLRMSTSNAKLRTRIEVLSLRVHHRHARLLRSLEDIFPIDLVDGSALLFSIAGIPLPNGVSSCSSSELEAQDKALKALVKARNKAVDEGETQTTGGASSRWIYHPLDDDTISTALGLVAQLTTLLSSYLGTPVHYPMATAGSRAVLQDGISIMNGPRAFPLYSKGVERYRYEYAVFQLNKNIEQLMNVHNVTVLDIRHTLPNLKNLIVTVSAAPPASYSTRKRHVGRNEISLISTTTAATAARNATSNGGVGKVEGDESGREEAIAQLGLGRPSHLSVEAGSETAAAIPKMNGAAKVDANAGATTATATGAKAGMLQTTRVLGGKATPATGDSAIESITKTLSFFESRQT